MSKISSLNDEPNLISIKMKEYSEMDLNTEKTAEIYQFPTVVTGGKDGGSGYWLMDMDVGTIFLARPKNDKSNFVCMEFALFEKYVRCALLFTNNPEGSRPLHVDMRRFSNQYEWVETIKKVPQSDFNKKEVIEGEIVKDVTE